ncbi:MAG: hypothetical protein QHJ73_04585, partial [Armatimonadota bacterium]|nr:hypothetical protein [Armatimonadota bacterium]
MAPAKAEALRLPLRLSASAALDNWLKENRVAAATAAKDRQAFAALPPDVQHAFAQAVLPEYARQLDVPTVVDKKFLVRLDPDRIVALITPSITGFSPQDAARDELVVVLGTNFGSTSEVIFNFNPAATYWLHFWGHILVFRVPNTGVTNGASYPVVVRNGSLSSAPRNFPVVAPRGYRGYHGWRFPNVGTAVIPWAVFRNYFGAAAVEFADGTHRPAAQAWYDSAYKGVGSGGNCYGMSL